MNRLKHALTVPHDDYVEFKVYDSQYALWLLNQYKLMPGDYMELYDNQQGKCAICEGKPGRYEMLSVDHCHTTGKVRGLLCSKCNTALGLFKDDIQALRKAIDYLT